MEATESSNQNKDLQKEELFDEVRGIFVASTPEERVRQGVLRKMLHFLAYPKELIAVEKALSELCQDKVPLRRVDIVCFAKKKQGGLYPLLVIECKEKASLLEGALAQMHGYNHFLKAPFLAVVHPEGEVFGYRSKGEFSWLSYLPSYPDLLRAVSNG